jgi:hypothetical protein
MHFIEHIIEPTKLLLAWQSSDEEHRTRYIVAELNRIDHDVTLTYSPEKADFITAQHHKFKSYPAFQDTSIAHHNVLDAFMRRLPPRSRGDFPQYLEGLRLKPTVCISDFALLGYSGAKLLSDGFSIIHPFNQVDGACELLIEAAGYRHLHKSEKTTIQIDSPASFTMELYGPAQETAIRIDVDNHCVGYVNRGLVPTFVDWIEQGRIAGAWVEKINSSPERPALYLYVKVAPKKS